MKRRSLISLKKVEVNIPLLTAIRQIPRYARYLKELCTNKRKLRGDEKIGVGENASAVIQKKLPPKCKDPGTFTTPCTIGKTRIEKCMLDLGASINVMPYAIYESLNLGPLKDTRVVIQLADRSNAYPQGVVEDVLVKVNELIFPSNFYVLEMEESSSPCTMPILLGRPFMKTTQTKIDVHGGSLTMEFDRDLIKFNIFEELTDPSDVNSVCLVAVPDSMPKGSGEQRTNDKDGPWWKTWLDYYWEHYNEPFIEWIKNKFAKAASQRVEDNYEFMVENEQFHPKKPG